MANYTTMQKTGEGTYACTYRGKDERTGEDVIIKEFDEREIGKNEANILRSLNSVNVVSLKEVISTGDSLKFILPFSDTDLHHYICHLGRGLDPALIQSYAYQLLSGLAHIHEKGIIHRDICRLAVLSAQMAP